MKKIYKYFGDSIVEQRNWLNEMARAGYRLVKTKQLLFTFEMCQPGEYVYIIKDIRRMSYNEGKNYIDSLRRMGYDAFYKNIRVGIRFPCIGYIYSTYEHKFIDARKLFKELIIVSKKNDGRPFDLP